MALLLLLCGGIAVVLVAMLITGKGFNPLRGMKPMIVTRLGEPGRYWSAVILWTAFLAITVWISFFAGAHSN
jgi:hypothetical protein